ncbi:MAG: hypothetical protein Q9165_007112 [Trypethelium subeluteriae]
MSSSTVPVLELPKEVLDIILSYLEPKSLLNLCSTCRALNHPDIRLNATYWRQAVRSYRVPNQPVIEGDGERWQKLYRRLVTQTHAYAWGSNEYGSLGRDFETQSHNLGSGLRRFYEIAAKNESVPQEMDDASKLGVLVDLQCTARATTVLTSQGILCSVGALSEVGNRNPAFRDMIFPPGFPSLRGRYDPSTAIQQFSAGLSHILALSDSGKIWFWDDIDEAGIQIKFVDIDILEGEFGQKQGNGRVKKVVAGVGWASALIEGTGIVTWAFPDFEFGRFEPVQEQADTFLVLQSVTIPGTSYERARKVASNVANERISNPKTPEEFDEVTDYLMLDKYCIFLTRTGRVFTSWEGVDKSWNMPFPLEIPVPNNTMVKAICGSSQSFGLVLANDEVLLATPDLLYLDNLFRAHGSSHRPGGPNSVSVPALKRYPCLQQRGVVSLAFGDAHWHALLRDGSILSGGKEVQTCGSFGLGGDGDPEGRIRGLRFGGGQGYMGHSRGDSSLLKQCYAGLGRQIWFEEEKVAWIRFMTSGGSDPLEAAQRMQVCAVDSDAQGELSEWLEQRGRNWERKEGAKEYDDDGLGPYFVLGIAAGGRHSGALVLRNDELVKKIRETCIVPDLPPSLPAGGVPVESVNEHNSEPIEQSAEQVAYGAIPNLIDQGWQSVRSALGLTPSRSTDVLTPTAESSATTYRRSQFCDPLFHGASPAEGFKYTWASDPFPRLRLSNGVEMPGEVSFSDWANGPPDWDLHFEA